jgi:hypothetical protein
MTHIARTLTVLLALVLSPDATLTETTPSHGDATQSIDAQAMTLRQAVEETPAPTLAPPTHGEIRIHEASPELSEAIDEAVALFDEAGLWLPELDIYVHRDKSVCSDAPGLFNKNGDAHRVDICTDGRSVVIHELAHAWEHHNVKDATREQFMALVGATSWNDGVDHWAARGVEQAAMAIQSGVLTDPLPPSRVAKADDLQAHFELLTGRSSKRFEVQADQTEALATAQNGSTQAQAPPAPRSAEGSDGLR